MNEFKIWENQTLDLIQDPHSSVFSKFIKQTHVVKVKNLCRFINSFFSQMSLAYLNKIICYYIHIYGLIWEFITQSTHELVNQTKPNSPDIYVRAIIATLGTNILSTSGHIGVWDRHALSKFLQSFICALKNGYCLGEEKQLWARCKVPSSYCGEMMRKANIKCFWSVSGNEVKQARKIKLKSRNALAFSTGIYLVRKFFNCSQHKNHLRIPVLKQYSKELIGSVVWGLGLTEHKVRVALSSKHTAMISYVCAGDVPSKAHLLKFGLLHPEGWADHEESWLNKWINPWMNYL